MTFEYEGLSESATPNFDEALVLYHKAHEERKALQQKREHRGKINAVVGLIKTLKGVEDKIDHKYRHAESQLIKSLRKREGEYPLNEIKYFVNKEVSVSSFYDLADVNYSGHFLYSFSWKDEVTGKDFTPDFSAVTIRAVKCEDDTAKVQITKDERPLLVLPDGFTVHIYVKDRAGTWEPMQAPNGLWKPQLTDKPQTLTIPF